MVHWYYSVDDYEVCHVDNEGAYWEAEVQDVAPADALAIENTVMVDIVNADIAEVAVNAVRMHEHVALVARVMPLTVRAW